LGNSVEGIKIDDASRTIIGTNNTDITKLEANAITGNGAHGVLITGANATGNKLISNFIGTNKLGERVPNGNGNLQGGVKIDGSNGNTIGDASANNGGNVISGNTGHGIEIVNSNNTTIQKNTIGLNTSKNAVVANTGDGIRLSGTSTNNLIGGAGGAPQMNIVSGNQGEGINDQSTGTNSIRN